MISSTSQIGKIRSSTLLACSHIFAFYDYCLLTYVHISINTRIQPPNLEQPINSALESGAWAKSIIWDSHTPFVDFTQLQLDDIEETVAANTSNIPTNALATVGKSDKDKDGTTKRKKRRGADAPKAQSQNTPLPSVAVLAKTLRGIDLKDKFNISNDRAYEISKERHRVRQTFGQLIVQHAYPAVKLQLPFVRVDIPIDRVCLLTVVAPSVVQNSPK